MRPERLRKRLEGGRTDGRTDVRTDGRKEIHPLCPTGHRPFGAAAQKGWRGKAGQEDRKEENVMKLDPNNRYHCNLLFWSAV